MRSSQEEQYKYFYIDRKFASGSLLQINDALDQLELFLGNMTRVDLINSFIMRLLQLLPSPKALTLKHRVAHIFHLYPTIISHCHARQEITNTLLKLIKHHDQSTRTVSLQIVTSLRDLFVRDVGLYHLLLGKISHKNSLGKSQKKEAIVCLGTMLSRSSHFSIMLSKNVKNVQEIYQIPLHILLFLLTFANIESHKQQNFLSEILHLFKDSIDNKSHKKAKLKYFSKIVLQFAEKSYRTLSFYENSQLSHYLSDIAPQIKKIKEEKFAFLASADECNIEVKKTLTLQDFIDLLYTKKSEGKLHQQYEQYKNQIHHILDKSIKERSNIESTLLLLYFIEDNTEQYDITLKKLIKQNLLPTNKKIFKKLAVVGCYRSALLILNQIEISEFNYIFLRSYLEFQVQKQPKQIQQLRQIASLMNNCVSDVVKGWQIAQKIFKVKENSSLLPLQEQLNKICNKVSQINQLQNITKIFSKILDTKIRNSQNQIKQSCFSLLPSSFIASNQFWFVYLDKQCLNHLIQLQF